MEISQDQSSSSSIQMSHSGLDQARQTSQFMTLNKKTVENISFQTINISKDIIMKMKNLESDDINEVTKLLSEKGFKVLEYQFLLDILGLSYNKTGQNIAALQSKILKHAEGKSIKQSFAEIGDFMEKFHHKAQVVPPTSTTRKNASKVQKSRPFSDFLASQGDPAVTDQSAKLRKVVCSVQNEKKQSATRNSSQSATENSSQSATENSPQSATENSSQSATENSPQSATENSSQSATENSSQSATENSPQEISRENSSFSSFQKESEEESGLVPNSQNQSKQMNKHLEPSTTPKQKPETKDMEDSSSSRLFNSKANSETEEMKEPTVPLSIHTKVVLELHETKRQLKLAQTMNSTKLEAIRKKFINTLLDDFEEYKQELKEAQPTSNPDDLVDSIKDGDETIAHVSKEQIDNIKSVNSNKGLMRIVGDIVGFDWMGGCLGGPNIKPGVDGKINGMVPFPNKVVTAVVDFAYRNAPDCLKQKQNFSKAKLRSAIGGVCTATRGAVKTEQSTKSN